MRSLRVLFVLVLLASVLFGVGLTSRPVSAGHVLVTDVSTAYPCTEAGLESAIFAAGTNDPKKPGLVEFECHDPFIEFDWQIQITGETEVSQVVIDGSNGRGDQIVLDGNAVTNFFLVGGGVHLTIKHMGMRDGFANGDGGAIEIDPSGRLTATAVTFTKNRATGSGSGGAISNSGGIVNVSESRFEGNFAAGNGGAISSVGGSLAVMRSSLVSNRAYTRGGAIIAYTGFFTLYASTLDDNTASQGSSVYFYSPTVGGQIVWSTIMQSTRTNRALGIEGNLTSVGNIFGGGGAHCQFLGSGKLIDSYTLSNDKSCGLSGKGSQEGLHSLGLGPRFSKPVNEVSQTFYSLLPKSPAVDALQGPCGSLSPSFPNTDQLGTKRPGFFSRCDIGAVEAFVLYPFELCASRWDGSLRVPDKGGCGWIEMLVELPQDAPLSICVSQWDASARMGNNCGWIEWPMVLYGNLSVHVCIAWPSGDLRVASTCDPGWASDWI